MSQAGERNLQVFIFPALSALLDPLSAWTSSPPPPLGQEGETCLPRYPTTGQHVFSIEEMVPKRKKIQSGAVSGLLCFTDFCLFCSMGLVVERSFGEGVESRGGGV